MNSAVDQIRDRIDDYKDTIFAITGFINLYRFDKQTRQLRSDIVAFQGRRLVRPNGGPVTPDLGVLHSPMEESVLGEVKKSFPQNEDLWMDDFRQLMSYDEDLGGWPTASGKVPHHDVVLLLHQSRAAKVTRFYESRKGGEIVFHRPFVVVEFNRADERKPYLFLRIVDGHLSASEVNAQLTDGVPVPLSVLLEIYSKVKLYDAEPPLPYLMELIWTNVVTLKASENEKFGRLRKNQRLDVEFTVDEITTALHQGYSFHSLSGVEGNNGPQIPKKEWVLSACKRFVQAGDADWTNEKVGIVFHFRRYQDVLQHFLEKTSDTVTDTLQLELFQDGNAT
jgi:hypothetical protein